MENLPKHVAIIPDGNRRWARARGLPAFKGHWEGAKSGEKIMNEALRMEIPCLTLWVGSVANLTERSPIEVKALFEIFEQYFKKLVKRKELYEKNIKVNVFGRWEELAPEGLKKAMREVLEKTKEHTARHFTILLGYTGMDEMTAAVKGILRGGHAPEEIDAALIKRHLWTRALPPVDLVIRTGSAGDPHWSAGFMMWDTANSQFYFTDTTWPDFSPEEFRKALEAYASRERRLGK